MVEPTRSWEYLEGLRGVELHKLYKSPPSALAVFRKVLSGLAKHFVMSMLYSPRPTTLSELELMVKASHSRDRHEAIEQLRRYHIVKDVNSKASKAIVLVPAFATSLRQILSGGGSEYSFGRVTHPPKAESVTVEDLDNFARMRWEGILGYTVGSQALAQLQEPEDELPPPDSSVIELLKIGHLVEVSGTVSRGQRTQVTKEGFAFVLKDVNTQIWELLFLFVENAERLGLEKIEILSFIFFVASLELGLAYTTESFSSSQILMLGHLLNLGIVCQPDEEAQFFFPTRLATTLTSSSSTALTAASQTLGSSLQSNSVLSAAHSTSPHQTPGSGFIIIETNFRLYAYTSSPLQIALLSTFVYLRSRHPNMVTGKLTKQSVQKAIQQGITAEQLCAYLSSHAHPVMRRTAAAEWARKQARRIAAADDTEANEEDDKFTVIPQTILDQIKLWQMERDRIMSTPGFYLHQFVSQAEYLDACRYADETGVLVWKDDKKRCFFVSRLEGVKAFLSEKSNR
ncbi:RNA polymerase II transcription factor B 52 kDa subunit [Lithohypha guttulata]|uniref:RNA polymerase II transcription factor B subunit 2 n=1 Tax=Lithohypha guttulata TaxID=1690604 RepID=A0AAN7SUQ5_9EURO|nr:RNA polymerase II transcription factor B 52 kDa subunit [Lithohypha guttulata]